ncbi:MAG: hypothetical protein A2017_01320 [Lentisphaerae bacterium GWF2_44_16]|nr:MAG: hypothetical protein A2017_01320 [Lentisphaerae bacterium GWF2_44_16]
MKIIFVLISIFIFFTGVSNAANISNKQGLFTLQSGDYRVAISRDCKYTMALIEWKDYKIVPLTGYGYNGAVLVYPPKGFVGCGHTEGGLEENVKSFSMSADGLIVVPEPGKIYSAQKFIIKKISMLGNLQLTSEIELTPNGIRVTRDLFAADNQQITYLYIFMFCFSNKFKDWYVMKLDSNSAEGTFMDSEKFLHNKNVKWAAMFDPLANKGVGLFYPQTINDKNSKTTFWDRKGDNKFYLFFDVPKNVEKGFSTVPKTVVVRAFEAEKFNWKSIAESTLSE